MFNIVLWQRIRGVRGSADRPVLEVGIKATYLTPIIDDLLTYLLTYIDLLYGRDVVLTFLSSVEEHIFRTVNESTCVISTKNFPGVLHPGTSRREWATPAPCPAPAHAFWPSIFSMLCRHCRNTKICISIYSISISKYSVRVFYRAGLQWQTVE